MKSFSSFRILKLMPFVWLIAMAATGCHARTEVTTPRKAAANEYHGVKVLDEYQWLENGADPAVQQWSREQNQRARAVLDNLPTRAMVEDRLTRLLTNASANYFSL